LGTREKIQVTFTEKQKYLLELMKKGTHSPLHLIHRATILLLFGEGLNPSDVARQTDSERNTVKKWRSRWMAAKPEIDRIEEENPRRLKAAVEAALQDAYRPGKPAKFTSEQVAHIIKIACDKPEVHGVPLSNWTPSALAREAIKQTIVEKISSRQVGRFLKRSGFEASPESVLAESEHH